MKKILLLVIAMALTSATIYAQTGWVDQKGDNRISVKFPVQPKDIGSGSYYAIDNDSTIYIFTIINYMKVAGMDSVALAKQKEMPEFVTGMKTGYNQSNPDVKIDDFKLDKWKGFTSYITHGADSKKRTWDIFVFIIGDNMYGLQTIRKFTTGPEGRDVFFRSVTVSN